MALTHFERTHTESRAKRRQSTKIITRRKRRLFCFSLVRQESRLYQQLAKDTMATTSETPQVQGAIQPGVPHFLFYHGKTFHRVSLVIPREIET